MRRMKAVIIGLVVLAALVALALIPGGEQAEVDIAEEFVLHPIIKLPTIGPFDLSINKAVIYLWISTAILALAAIAISRVLRARPGRLQAAIEGLYELAHDGITRSVMQIGMRSWFPYVGAVFFFVLVNNLVGLIPLPLGEHHQLAFYVATGNLNVTIVLALFTFFFTHYAGIRQKGLLAYAKSWDVPSAPPVIRQLLYFMELVSEIFRLVSLSVRLFANMIAGHVLFAVFFAVALVFQSYLMATLLQVASATIYLFEIFVAVIQAFIFAILSAVYIEGAMEEGH